MTMTKKEQEEMEALQTRLALRYHPPVEPDIEVPGKGDLMRCGYMFNAYNRVVMKACTTEYSHNLGTWDNRGMFHAKGGIRLYSTKRLAYMALLNELSEGAAKTLREVELRMEREADLDK